MHQFTDRTTTCITILPGVAARFENWPSYGFSNPAPLTKRWSQSQNFYILKERSKSMICPSFELAILALRRPKKKSVATRICTLMHQHVNSFRCLCKNATKPLYFGISTRLELYQYSQHNLGESQRISFRMGWGGRSRPGTCHQLRAFSFNSCTFQQKSSWNDFIRAQTLSALITL
jgi:hypothetical protein